MTVRILQLGMGIRGEQWSKVIRSFPETVNVGYMRTNLELAKKQVIEWGEPEVPCFDDLDEALDKVKPDLVVIVTPPEFHLDQCRKIFKRGIHVICEKPLTETYEESIEIVRLAEKANVLLGVCMNFRYLNVTQTFRRLITDGTMGKPSFSVYFYERNRDARRRDLNKYPITMEQPMLLEQSIHHFDLMRYCYADEIKYIQCDTWRPEWSTYNDDPCVAAMFEFESGMRLNYHGCWTTAWNVPDFFWRTDCSNGVLLQKELHSDLFRTFYTPDLAIRLERASWMINNEHRFEPLIEVPVEPDVAFLDDTYQLLKRFIKAMNGESELETSGIDHMKSLGVTLACVEASKTGKRIRMNDFYKKHNIPSKWL